METTVIAINQITKLYPNQPEDAPALAGLTLNVKKGQLFGLVGPDGAGKTSLIRILATVILPSSGTATLNGFDVITQPEQIHPLVGYMPQNFSLYPDLSVQENLEFFADINQVPQDSRKARFSKLLDFTNLQPFKDRRSANLSGGMRKKLALACAMVHQPTILLLDEPTTGVDPISRREFWTILSEIALQGVTIFISTPYMDEAERCQTVGLLQSGRLLRVSEPKTLTAELPFEVLELTAENLDRIGALIEHETQIKSYRIVGDRMRIQVKQAGASQKKIAKVLDQSKTGSYTLRKVRKTMDDVFLYITGADL